MRIIIDAMGGDNAPISNIRGAVRAKNTLSGDIKFTLVGDKTIIENAARAENISLDGIDIVHTDVTVAMEDSPTLIVRAKKESSMAVGMKLLNPDNGYGEMGDAFISAGSTGALHVGSAVFVGRLDGVKRSCISALLPFENPVLLLDAGANVVVTEDQLCHWALIGSIYMKSVMGVEAPRVGLLNNGAEETKGTELYISTYKSLSALRDAGKLNFVGNIEARDMPLGASDVIVCDGFTGNIALKLSEGMGKFMMKKLKGVFSANIFTKLGYLLTKSQLGGLKKSIDASEHGGAPLLGLNGVVIKAHGSSDEKVIFNTIKQAAVCVNTDMIGKMKKALSELDAE